MNILQSGPIKTALAILVSWLAVANPAAAVVVSDNFTGTTSANAWLSFNGACLTAGNVTSVTGNNCTSTTGLCSPTSLNGTIPACTQSSYYNLFSATQVGGLPDTAGNGALRLTNADNYQRGAIVSNFTFPSDQGIQATFTTVTYGGDNQGGHGADGISFYLADGSQAASVGATGGSLGYSCSNGNPTADGVIGGYLGLGIDEYGNFLNEGDNTKTGYGYQAGRIGLRGAGNVSWTWLNQNYASNYPSSITDASTQQQGVQQTCSTGYVQKYKNGGWQSTTTPVPLDYAIIPTAYQVLPSNQPIANESATVRGNATPISYKLKLTQDGYLSFWYSYNGGTYQSVIANQSITASNGTLPSTFRFGFAGSTGGSTNVHEILCFKATPAEQSAGSAGINQQQAGQVRTSTQVYLAGYHSDNWWGQLTSQYLQVNSSNGVVTINPTATWDASCVLTGGNCSSTGVTSVTAQTSANRSILTWNGTTGIPFQWSNLTTAQQTALNQGDSNGQTRLAFLRGDRTNELTSSGTGTFRARSGVLGDIINSSPVWVGAPSILYPSAAGATSTTWSDQLYSSATMPENGGSATTYGSFQTSYATRLNVVYAGSNDGLLHGFRSGSYDASGNYVSTTTPNDGKEVLAYMPAAVTQTIHSTTSGLDYSSTQYGHNFFVDATPTTDDLFYNNNWHTWLVGGLGAGGKAIYALDITDPTQFSETNSGSLVIGEWNNSTLTNLGQTYGTPQIRRLHNGQWGVIFGNGFNSTAGHAGIYIMLVDPSNGNKSFKFLDTGSGSSSTPNGIAFVTPVDLDGDHITDYVYAGDVYGNVWKFDLTSSNPATWAVVSTPIFTTPNSQPITTKVLVTANTTGPGLPRVIVSFGTGQQTPQTLSNPAVFASGTQSLYGIWDWNTGSWNSLGSTQYASLTGTQSISTSTLQSQTVLGTYNSTTNGSSQGYRTLSSNAVCWKGSTACSSNNNKYGWYLNLPTSTEQVIYSPILYSGSIIINTTIPPTNTPLTCTASTATGWTMAINPVTGGAFQKSFFGDANNNFITYNGQVVSGIALNATGSPSVVISQNSPYLLNETANSVGTVNKINPPNGSLGSRVTWIELR
ncbi:pilus assembly protein [Andreprevotia chitinilytica]|uniref:pilus assembly protein n=1 Tax=Andreprevotia chitinilytica TaxID=396808 RepID=UPI00068FB09F|nr:PilC/PilY family type IV pilus protein [Andreprevotia chitinilytica]